MKKSLLRAAVVFIVASSVVAQSSGSAAMLGFSAANASQQRALEAKFDAVLRPENLRTWMKRLTARPHHLGSAYDKENADFMASLFRSRGFTTAIERFDVLFTTPKTRLWEMTAPQKFTARLEETPLKEDSTSGQKSEQLPVYNA